MRPLLVKYQIPQPVIQNDGCYSHQYPQQAVLQAYLSAYISRHPAVVPHIPAKSQIDHATGQEFQRRDDSGSNQCLLPDRHAPRDQLIDKTDQDKTHPTKAKHCPMRPAAPKQLHAYVQPASD